MTQQAEPAVTAPPAPGPKETGGRTAQGSLTPRLPARSEVSFDERTNHMAGCAELAALQHELREAEDLKAPVTASPEGTS
jgi:hypothetical protein